MSSRLRACAAGPRRWRSVAVVLVLSTVLSACADQKLPLNTLDPVGRAGKFIDDLAKPVFLVAIAVFFITNLGVLFIAIRFRRREGEEDVFPEQVHGNTKLELTWTILPAVILAFIAFFTLITLFKLTNTPADTAFTVQVEGQQWWWSFTYDTDNNGKFNDPGDLITATELVIPVGKPVALKITSNDVIHSFWIPKLNGKKDAVPGRIHDWWIESDEPGYFLGQCTEFCGLSHAYMRMAVRALPKAEFDTWLAAQKKPAQLPTDEAAKRGLEVFATQCAGCHVINGINEIGCQPYTGKVDEFKAADFKPDTGCYLGIAEGLKAAAQVSGKAPNLTHLMSRERFIGGVYDLYVDGQPNRNTIKDWVRNPSEFKALKPLATRDNKFGRGMPKLPLTEQQIDDVVSYLLTLK